MKNSCKVAVFALLAAVLAAPGVAEPGRRKKKQDRTECEVPARLPRHPALGVPVFGGAREASEKTVRGLGLDAFDGYRIGVFFTNAAAVDVAAFYIRALGRTVKKEKTEETLRYTLMIEPPSADNPLGEKVVVDENEGGVRDETGESFRTSITVYRKIPAAPKK
jgi:hypothetical protein